MLNLKTIKNWVHSEESIKSCFTSLSETEEDRLVEEAQNGSAEAFAALMGMYWSAIYNYLRRLAGDNQAGELTQETFFRAYRSLSTTGTGNNRKSLHLRPWLYRIATNLAINNYRRQSRRWLSLDWLNGDNHAICDTDIDLTPAWLLDPSPSPDDTSIATETSQLVVTTLLKMPKEQTALLLLRFYHDLSIEEIAQVLNIKPVAVRGRLYRARQTFRRLYAQTENSGERERIL